MLSATRKSVADHEPLDQAEANSIAAFLHHFDRLESPLSEHADPVHVTGSAVVVGSRGVVLLKHKHLSKWLQPGGHIDPGETPWETAIREAEEETGLNVRFADTGDVPELIHVDVHPAARGHTHLDLRYLLIGGDEDPSPPPEESQEIAWFDWDAAIEMADDERLSALLTHLSGRDWGESPYPSSPDTIPPR